MKRVAFLVSGSGTNMENLIKRIRAGEVRADPVIVISNKPGVKALEKAVALDVKTIVIDHKAYADRDAFDKALSECLEKHKADIIVLAGFMRVLTEGFVKKYYGRLINIHPALLPQFPGAHAIRDAWDAKVKETGVTVHFIDPGVDTGPIILQRKVPVLPNDTFETLEARIHEVEHDLYPKALNFVLAGKIKPKTTQRKKALVLVLAFLLAVSSASFVWLFSRWDKPLVTVVNASGSEIFNLVVKVRNNSIEVGSLQKDEKKMLRLHRPFGESDIQLNFTLNSKSQKWVGGYIESIAAYHVQLVIQPDGNVNIEEKLGSLL